MPYYPPPGSGGGILAPYTLAGVGDTIPFTINAAIAQTAHLQVWQVDSIEKARFAANGTFTFRPDNHIVTCDPNITGISSPHLRVMSTAIAFNPYSELSDFNIKIGDTYNGYGSVESGFGTLAAAWNISTTYAAGDRVSYADRDFTSIAGGNIGNVPTAGGDAFWNDTPRGVGLTFYSQLDGVESAVADFTFSTAPRTAGHLFRILTGLVNVEVDFNGNLACGDITSSGNAVVTTATYASAGVAGAIKVGSGLSIDGSGILSSAGGGLTAPYTLNGVGDTVPLTINGIAGQTAKLQSWQVNSVERAYVDANGSISVVTGFFSGNMYVSTTGSSAVSPRILGFSDLASGRYGRFQFGDSNTAVQGGFGQKMQLTSYWGIEIWGNRQAAGPASFSDGGSSDPALLVQGTTAAAPVLRVNSPAAQTGPLQEWLLNGATKASMSKDGILTIAAGGGIVMGSSSSGASINQTCIAGWRDTLIIQRGGAQKASIGMSSDGTDLQLFTGSSTIDANVRMAIGATGLVAFNGTTLTTAGIDLKSVMANGASAIAVQVNTSVAYSTAGAKLLSVKNNGTEKAYVDKDGFFTSAGSPMGRQVAVPASATAAGTVGDFAADASWAYFCTATNTWVRCAVATW